MFKKPRSIYFKHFALLFGTRFAVCYCLTYSQVDISEGEMWYDGLSPCHCQTSALVCIRLMLIIIDSPMWTIKSSDLFNACKLQPLNMEYENDVVVQGKRRLVVDDFTGIRIPESKVHGAHLGPVGPRWAPFWSHKPCYQGIWLCYSTIS